jgi:uncharacterized protein with HEPN domain
MLDAARDAVAFASGRAPEDLGRDRQFALALVKCIEIVGEAASQVSAQTQGEIPSMPWREMAGMRHRLVHAYYDINLNVLWRTVRNDLPPLIALLESVPGLESGPTS